MAATKKHKGVSSYGTIFLEGIVTVEVGSERAPYQVHKALLTEHSDYFRKALGSSWKESEENKICLDDIECGDFESFIKWLYAHRFTSAYEDWTEDEEDEENDDTTTSVWTHKKERALLGACVMGDRLQARDYRHAAERSCVRYFVRRRINAGAQTIIFAFENLPASNPILRMLIHVQCEYFNTAWKKDSKYLESRQLLPKEFLLGVMERHTKIRRRKHTPLEESDYHDQVAEEERSTCSMPISIIHSYASENGRFWD